MTKEQKAAARTYRAENKAAAERIDRAFEMMRTQGEYSGSGDSEDVTDLLADLRHFCDKEGLDFGELDSTAHRHYTAEVVQARTGVTQ